MTRLTFAAGQRFRKEVESEWLKHGSVLSPHICTPAVSPVSTSGGHWQPGSSCVSLSIWCVSNRLCHQLQVTQTVGLSGRDQDLPSQPPSCPGWSTERVVRKKQSPGDCRALLSPQLSPVRLGGSCLVCRSSLAQTGCGGVEGTCTQSHPMATQLY